jgi:hypothetical protein
MTPPRVLRKGWLLGVLLVAPFMAQAAFAVVALLATATAALTTRQARPPKSRNCGPRAEPGEAGNNDDTRYDASFAPVLADAIVGVCAGQQAATNPGTKSGTAGPHDSQRQGVYRT